MLQLSKAVLLSRLAGIDVFYSLLSTLYSSGWKGIIIKESSDICQSTFFSLSSKAGVRSDANACNTSFSISLSLVGGA